MEPSELLAAIGTALGLEHPYEEISGLREEEISVPRGWVPPKERSLHVLGGAEDAHGRVAWIEEVVHGSEEVDQPYMTDDAETGKWVERTYRETWVHSNLVLRAAKAGKELRFAAESRVEVPTYNPYFGCEVGRMLWMGDAVVTLYREKHETIVWVVPLEGEPRLVTVTSSAVVHGTDLYFQGREPGILLGVSLPDLRPLVPIPTVTTVDGASLVLAGDEIVIAREGRHEEKEEGIPVERVRLPERGSVLDPEKARALPARVIEALFGERPPQPTADLLVGAVLTPFYDPRIRIRKTYDEGYEHWFSPHWLPAYWHRFLVREGRSREAEAHLAILDDIASRPETTGDEPLLCTATRHVIQRARVLAAVCRERRLPEQWSCPFWPRVDNVFRKRPPQAAPARMVEAMGLMAARPPELGDHWHPLVDD